MGRGARRQWLAALQCVAAFRPSRPPAQGLSLITGAIASATTSCRIFQLVRAGTLPAAVAESNRSTTRWRRSLMKLSIRAATEKIFEWGSIAAGLLILGSCTYSGFEK